MLEKQHTPDNSATKKPSTANQDVDLYSRLNNYLNRVDLHIKQGRGWFIFNADRTRAARIVSHFLERLRDYSPYITYNHIPWRDFALDAYMRQHLNTTNNQPPQTDEKLNKEYNIARKISSNTSLSMLTSDLLIISGLAPGNSEEVNRLGQVVVGRHTRQMATVLVSPRMPHELAQDFEKFSNSSETWSEFYRRMYESSLMAL
jgi:hypothetical protein